MSEYFAVFSCVGLVSTPGALCDKILWQRVSHLGFIVYLIISFLSRDMLERYTDSQTRSTSARGHREGVM